MGKMQFWGICEGRGKEVGRGGTKDSGLAVDAAGWKGRIRVKVHYNEKKDRDEFTVYLRPHWNADSNEPGEIIASGILDYEAFKEGGAYIPALIA